MLFSYNNQITLTLNETIVDVFTGYIKHNWFTVESGGILIGTLNPATNQIIATDVTVPQQKDKQSAFAFSRAEYGHQEMMNELWEQSGRKKTYLGEWHTHNQNIPKPSHIDKINWLKISERKQNSNWLFFVIIGKKEIGVWTINNKQIIEMTRISL